MARGTPEINGVDGGYRVGPYREFAVPARLVHVAEVAWRYSADDVASRTDGAAAAQRVLPETGVSLVFDCHRDSRGRVDAGALVVMGPVTAFRYYRPQPDTELVGLRLRPEWCHQLLGLDPGDASDAIADTGRGGWTGELRDRLAGTPHAAAAASQLLAAVGRRQELVPADTALRLTHQALEYLRRGGGLATGTPAALSSLGVSPRHLRRIVTDTCGFGMKWFQRVRRLHRAVSASVVAPTESWATVAAAAGYYDQAHMIREFRALCGVTPVELLAERLPGIAAKSLPQAGPRVRRPCPEYPIHRALPAGQ